MSNVRSYTNEEILDRVRSLPSFNGFPKDYWLCGIRSDEDTFNTFDDKFYLFRKEKFIAVWNGTTNAGTDLLNPTNKRGEAVLKADGIYYDSHTRRKHRGKVMAYCQRIPLPIHRDNNKNKKAEELGTASLELVGINIHPSSYQTGSNIVRTLINGWSAGCSVFSVRSDFDKFMKLTEGQQNLTYCLLKEFTPSKVSATTSPKTIPIDSKDVLRQTTAHTTILEEKEAETPFNEQETPMPVSQAAPQDAPISVQQVKPEESPPPTEPENWYGKFSAKLLAIPAGILSFISAFGAWLQNSPLNLILALLGMSALIVVVYLIAHMLLKNRREKDENQLKRERELRAFELQKLTLESAMNRNLNTVTIVPQPIANSDAAEQTPNGLATE